MNKLLTSVALFSIVLLGCSRKDHEEYKKSEKVKIPTSLGGTKVKVDHQSMKDLREYLTSEIPLGGYFEGNGVVDKYYFDYKSVGDGIYIMSYRYGTESHEIQIEVNKASLGGNSE